MLSFHSLRLSLRTAPLSLAKEALDSVGHVVIEDVWNLQFLHKLSALAQDGFCKLPKTATHLGEFPARLNEEFYAEFERAGLNALLRPLLGDFFVGTSERVIRRADPENFTGLHQDGQLSLCRKHTAGKQEYTIWTPLQDCLDDATPRLLLLQRGSNFVDLFPEAYHLPVQLKPSENTQVDLARAEEMFETIYQTKPCFAPKVPLGAAVVFHYSVIHGSYRHKGMNAVRYSFDFRACSKYQRLPENSRFMGRTFSCAEQAQSLTQARAHVLWRSLRGDRNARLAIGNAITRTVGKACGRSTS